MHATLTTAIALAVGDIASWLKWPGNRSTIASGTNLIVIEKFCADSLRISEEALSGCPAGGGEPFYVVVADGVVTKVFEGNQPQPVSEERMEHLCTMLNRTASAEASVATPSLTQNRTSYSVREAASLLGVGLSTLYDAVKCGEVPNVGVGRAVRVKGQWLRARLV